MSPSVIESCGFTKGIEDYLKEITYFFRVRKMYVYKTKVAYEKKRTDKLICENL